MSTVPTGGRGFYVHSPLDGRRVETWEASPNGALKGPPQFAVPAADCSRECCVSPGHGWYVPLKRGFDLTFAAVLLILFSPILLAGVLLVKLTSRGPALYRQVRLGTAGRPFTLLKLRTMKNNAEAETGPVWSTENDCRVTPLGKFLRRTHIDEFPQLWNVIRGDMSLVGPRPERPEFVAKLDWEVPFYRERLQIRPGITGLAQLRLPPDSTLECVRRKVIHDVYYVRHVNPFLDMKLLVLTAWHLVKEMGNLVLSFFALPSNDDVDLGFRRAVGIPHEAPPVPHVSLTGISAGRDEVGVDMLDFQRAGG